MVTPRYSRQPEHIAKARDYLLSCVDRPDDELPTYDELAASFGGAPLNAVPVLYSIALACENNGEPDLSVLVVNGATGAPGAVGGQSFDAKSPAAVAAWQVELAAVRIYSWPLPGTLPPWTPPRVGAEFSKRSAIKAVWGGDDQGGMSVFPGDPERIVNIFSDDAGPYPDRRVPGSDRIEYIGQGRSGDQKLTSRGNALTEEARNAVRACRYWYRPVGGVFTFERWVVIVGRHKEWHRGEDGLWREAFVYDLAPVGSATSSEWPADVLAEAQAKSVDSTLPPAPPDAALPNAPSLTDLYKDLTERAKGAAGKAPGERTAKEYARSASARNAVLLRAQGSCENPTCAGMACDVRPNNEAILDVDHVKDLALGGADEPHNMVALCPNCHAAKTRGKLRESLRRALVKVAVARHDATVGGV